MNWFAAQALIGTALAVLGLPAAYAQPALAPRLEGITNGMSRAGVIALLGTPKGDLIVGGSESLLFETDTVTLQNGRVVSDVLPLQSPAIPAAVAGKHPAAPASDTDAADIDWPQWRGPNRNGVIHSSPPLAAAWPDRGPKKVWEAHPVHVARCYGHNGGISAGGYSCPVVAGERTYLFIHDKGRTQEMVVCLSAQTGATCWIQKFTAAETMHGASSTPCVADGRLFVTGSHVSYCLNALTGAVIWQGEIGELGKRQEVSSSFLVVDEIAATILGPCYGLNAGSGEAVWSAQEPGSWSSAMTSPVCWRHDGKAYLIYCGFLHMCCVEAGNGKLLWDVLGNKAGGRCAPTPALAGDHLAVYWHGKLGAYHLTPAGPKVLWEVSYFDRAADDSFSSAILDKSAVYAAGRQQGDTNTSVICYDLATGKPRWVCPIPNPEYSSPILADGKLIVLGNSGKRLLLVESQTGKLLATETIYPHPPRKQWDESIATLAKLIQKHKGN